MKSCPVCGALLADQAVDCPNCAAIKAAPKPARAAAPEKKDWWAVLLQTSAWSLGWVLRAIGYFLVFSLAVLAVLFAVIYSATAGYLALCAVLVLATFVELRRPAPGLIGIFVFLLGFGGCGLIAIPQLSDLIRKNETSGTLGQLSSVRSAIQVYYGDSDGSFPADLGLLVPKYLSNGLPAIKLPGHSKSNAVQYLSGEEFRAGKFSDAGGWAYVNSPDDQAAWGSLVLNCTHLRHSGAGPGLPWSTF